MVIFSSVRSGGDRGYAEMAARMERLAAASPGFLGMDSARGAAPDDAGITVCYWESLQAIGAWRRNLEHLEAQRLGRERWYRAFRVRIARVEREYGMGPETEPSAQPG